MTAKKKKEKEKKPPNCSWPNASQVGQYQASAGGLGPLPSQCLIKPASFPDQGIKVWVICIDFVCCHAEPVMLISAIHKFPFKMSPLLHFLHDPSILQPEGTLMIPKGCRLVWKTLEHCTSPEFSPISTVGREWVRRVVRKILNNNNNKKNLAKIFSDMQKDFSSLSREPWQMDRPSSGSQGCSEIRGGLSRHHLTSLESPATPTNSCIHGNFDTWLNTAITGYTHSYNSAGYKS